MITPDPTQSPFMQNPLALQFMTGGQMGYMPQAQFLTPASYGAFRTMPAPDTGIMPMQRPSMLQSYMIATRGSLSGMLPNYTLSNYMMGADQSLYQTMARRRMQDAGSAFGSTVGNMGINGALSLALGFGNPLAMAGISAVLPDFAAPYTDRIGMQRRIQDMSLSRITSGRDVARGLGQGFSAQAAARLDESIRSQSAGDALFKEEDYRQIMRTGVESGLFDYANSASEYKRNIKQLRDNINVMGELLGSTDFKELMSGMKRLMTMGADVSQMNDITQMERMFSRMTGLRHGAMVSTYGQQGALTFSQAGLTNYQGSLSAMSHAAEVTMAQRLGILDPATVARYGGVSGMAQNLTQQQAGSIRRTQDFYLPAFANGDFSGINQDKLAKFMSGDIGVMDLARGAGRLQDVNQFGMYEANKAKLQQQLMDKLGPDQFKLMERQMALQWGRSMGASDDRHAMLLGFQSLGYDEQMALQQANQWSDQDFVKARMANVATEARRTRFSALEQQMHQGSFFNRVAVGWNEGLNSLASPFKSLAARRARRVQRDEDRELGIVGLSGPGPAQVAGFDQMSDAAVSRLLKGRDLNGMMADYVSQGYSDESIAYQIGSGVGGLTGRGDRIRVGKDIRLLAESNLGAADAWAGLEKSGLFSSAALAGEMDQFNSVDDLSSSSVENMVAAAIRKTSGVSGKKAREQARALLADEKNRERVLVALAGENKAFGASAALHYKDRMGTALGKQYENWDDYLSKRQGNIGELTAQHFGFIDDGAQRDLLEESMGKDIRSLDVYGMQALHTKANASGTTREERERLRKAFVKQAVNLGLTEEEANEVFNSRQGMSHRLVTDRMNKVLGKDRVSDLVSAGKKTGSGLGSADDALALQQRVLDTQADQFAMQSQRQSEVFGKTLDKYGLSVKDLTPAKIRELMAKHGDSDPRLRELLNATQKARAAGAPLTLESIGSAQWGTVEGLYQDTELLTGKAAKEGQGEAADKLDATLGALEDVLRSLPGSMQQVAFALQASTETQRRMMQQLSEKQL